MTHLAAVEPGNRFGKYLGGLSCHATRKGPPQADKHRHQTALQQRQSAPHQQRQSAPHQHCPSISNLPGQAFRRLPGSSFCPQQRCAVSHDADPARSCWRSSRCP